MKIGDAIPDTGIRMAALNELLGSGAVDQAGLLAALKAGIEKVRASDELWFEEDGERQLAADENMEEILRHGVAALATVEVDAAQLAAIETLSFDGGEDIYMWFEETMATELGLEDWELDTGGESDLYVVGGFEGIGALTALSSLSLDAYGWSDSARDARPLASLPALATLDLCGAVLEHGEALAGMESLAEVKGAGGLDDATKQALRDAGKTVG